MLVLSRKQQQQIKIGDHITVTIVKVKGNTVRVGIEAPRNVRVIRAELPKEGSETETPAATAEVTSDASDLVAQSINEAAPAQTNTDEKKPNETPTDQVFSFGVRWEAGDEPPTIPAARSAAHLPLKRLHDRFGN